MKKIFIIDDEALMGKMYQLNLKKIGYVDTILFRDGMGVIEAVKTQKPDLVLLDIMMPNKNGFDVIKEIREDNGLANIQIMVITNLSQPEDVQEIKRLGANYYINKSEKPFSEVLAFIQQKFPQ